MDRVEAVQTPKAPSGTSRTVWVIPVDPTTIYERVFPLPLPGTDRINFEIAISNVVPGPLNEEILVAALRSTLKYYPHANGRVRRNGDDWSLGAGKRGVPITFETIAEPLDHHQKPSFVSPVVVDSISTDISGANEPDWDEPMLRLKITFCPKTRETFIGWSSSHMLGDGEFVYQFMYAWSQFYQGEAPKFGMPTYEKYRTAPPDEINDNPSTASFISRYLPHLAELHPIDKWAEMIGEAFNASTPVDILFTADHIQQLRTIADSWPGRTGSGTSAHDAIAGYIITTMNRCLEKDKSITRVSSIFSYRGIKNPPDLKPTDWRVPGLLAIGNVMFHALTPTLSSDESSSIGALAAAIRKSVRDARNYEHVKRVVAVSNPIWLRQSKEGSEHKFWDDRTLIVNSMGRANWSLQHFGFGPHRIRTHAYKDFPGFVRCFQCTPSKQLDGTWNVHDGDVWIFMRVPTEIHDRFMAMVAADLNSLEFPHNVAKRERVAQGRILGAVARL
ncbi:hypothetical protein FB45DRAFT_59150 [Roridomyces roridus]|uniref:Uncharacterized protein n=1 Tax=Roridomyces roridus TaxID=1738132 RepID=A0AAD7BQ45_9AGAR|nr:hypothetical protein FB45DRAFT_59150 [Roridomyces roridus]